MTEADLQTLRVRWTTGWHERLETDEGTNFDMRLAPLPGNGPDDEAFPHHARASRTS
jgi:hypothetical protein